MKVERKKCPECGAVEVVPIVYGYLSAPPTGDVVYAGCCVTPARWACRECGAWFAGDDEGGTLKRVVRS